MRNSYKIVSFFLLINTFVQAQFKYSSNTAHISIRKAIEINTDIIKERTLNFEKKAESKPLMFVNVKKKISELNRVANNLSAYLEEIQKEVVPERVLSDLLQDNFYYNILFVNQKELTERGKKLKLKIDELYQVGKSVNIHKLTHLDDYVNEHFNTNEEYYDAYEKKINFFEYHFHDTSNYGIMMSMNYLLLDIKIFQLVYYRTIMSY